tara:strand:+ start:6762 stop:7070 length:309 start_codon:yes stop_codon:yes gene_type:complete
MSSNIIFFPKHKISSPTGYRINLYTEEQIDIVLFCINMTLDRNDPSRYTRKDLKSLDPEYVISKMTLCLDSTFLSKSAKEQIRKIIHSIEIIPLSVLKQNYK